MGKRNPTPPPSGVHNKTIGSNEHTAFNLIHVSSTKHLSLSPPRPPSPPPPLSHAQLATSPSGESREFAKGYSYGSSSTLMQIDDRRSTSPGRKPARRLHMAPGRFIDGHFTHATANTPSPASPLPPVLSTLLSFPATDRWQSLKKKLKKIAGWAE